MSVLRGEGRDIIAAAPTGIAVTLLHCGRTVHSIFKLPILLHESSTSLMKPDSREWRKLASSSLILIDESSMLSQLALKTVDHLLKDIMKNLNDFGFFNILFGGDFRQCLRVVPKGGRVEIVSECLKNSSL